MIRLLQSFMLWWLFRKSFATLVCNDDVVLTLYANANVLNIPSWFNISSFNPSNASSFVSVLDGLLQLSTIGGQYLIAGRYCQPTFNVPSRAGTIQLLVHGAGYERNYWSGLGPPGNEYNGTYYSWIDYAASQGYATFSVDRLCYGQSSHLPGADCQLEINAAVLNQVIAQLKLGLITGLRTFNQVIWVGHSIGSLIGNVHAQNYPGAVSAYLLTGFSDFIANGAPGAVVANRLESADSANPQEYGDLDSNYVISTSQAGYEEAFYHGDFNPLIVTYDYDRTHPIPVGELVSITTGQQVTNYGGPVLVLTGQNDFLFCSQSAEGSIAGVPGNCGSGASSLLAQTSRLYPDASVFQPTAVPDTGHVIDLHLTSQQSFAIAHSFLASQGF